MNFIFDMDGTMFRNLEYHFEAWQALFTERNKPFTEHTRNSLLGQTAQEAVRKHFGPALASLLTKARTNYREQPYMRKIFRNSILINCEIYSSIRKVTKHILLTLLTRLLFFKI